MAHQVIYVYTIAVCTHKQVLSDALSIITETKKALSAVLLLTSRRSWRERRRIEIIRFRGVGEKV